MADTITFRVDGLQELSQRMRKMSEDMAKKAAARATSKAGSLVKKAAKNNLKASPSIDTGLLEKHVIIKKIPKSKTALTSEHIVTVKKDIYRRPGDSKRVTTRKSGSLLEHGTVNMPAEPWLGPALSRNVQPAINAIKDTLAKEITKAGK